MADFDKHPSHDRTTVLLVGASGAGKTRTFATLANNGYKVRILDFDNGLDILKDETLGLTEAGRKNVSFISLRDDPTVARPVSWERFTKILLNGWKDGDEDLGSLKDWGPDTVLVIDSLTFAGEADKRAAVYEAKKNQYAAIGTPEYGTAGRQMSWALELITNPAWKFHIVATAIESIIEGDSGVAQIYPDVVTRPFSQKMKRYFNNIIYVKQKQTEKGAVPFFLTKSTNRIELRTSAPSKVPAEMPADLNELFKILI